MDEEQSTGSCDDTNSHGDPSVLHGAGTRVRAHKHLQFSGDRLHSFLQGKSRPSKNSETSLPLAAFQGTSYRAFSMAGAKGHSHHQTF